MFDLYLKSETAEKKTQQLKTQQLRAEIAVLWKNKKGFGSHKHV